MRYRTSGGAWSTWAQPYLPQVLGTLTSADSIDTRTTTRDSGLWAISGGHPGLPFTGPGMLEVVSSGVGPAYQEATSYPSKWTWRRDMLNWYSNPKQWSDWYRVHVPWANEILRSGDLNGLDAHDHSGLYGLSPDGAYAHSPQPTGARGLLYVAMAEAQGGYQEVAHIGTPVRWRRDMLNWYSDPKQWGDWYRVDLDVSTVESAITKANELDALVTSGRLSAESLASLFGTKAEVEQWVMDALGADDTVAQAAAAAVTAALASVGDVSDPMVAAAVLTPGSDTMAALTGALLGRTLTSPTAVTYGDVSTTFTSKGITLKGPLQENETENLADHGARLTIHSSHGARNSGYGEGLRMVVDTNQAKNMIAWYDNFTEPGRLKLKAWFGYHHGTYPNIVHDHISIETPNADGGLYTRLGVSTTPSECTNIDLNMSDVQHTASQGGKFRLAVGGAKQTTHPRDLVFATGTGHADSERRWTVRADTTAESGGNQGSDLRVLRHTDAGTPAADPVLAVTRHDGHVGIGTEPDAAAQLTVNGDLAFTDAGDGPILQSPDGTKWRLRVSNSGALSAEAV